MNESRLLHSSIVLLALGASFGCNGKTNENGDASSTPIAPASDDSGQNATTSSKDEATLQDVKDDAMSALDGAAKLTEQQQEKIAARLNERLAQLKTKVDDLRARAKNAADEAQPEIQAKIDQLQQGVADAQERLQARAEKATAAWKEFGKGVDAALDELENSTAEAYQELQEPNSATDP